MIVGTPAYMPPEQAKGQVDRVDRRADVFSLGAILCEILTAQPPYVSQADEITALAMLGHLAPARERLRGCGADAELVALVERCLEVNPDDRPADAVAVAEAVARYRAGVQERLRRAEVERAESQARAEAEARERITAEEKAAAERRERQAAEARATAERRARRLTLALAATALLLLTLVGVGAVHLWGQQLQQQQERFRQEAEELQRKAEQARRDTFTEADLKEFTENIGKVVPVKVLDQRAELDQAEKALARAEGRLDGTADKELQAREQQGRRTLNRLRREQQMLQQLDEARLRSSQAGEGILNHAATDKRYRKAYADYGIDVAQLDPRKAAALVRASDLHVQLVEALDHWVASLPADYKPWKQKLQTIADAADNSDWRQQVQEVLRRADGEGGRRLAALALRTALPVPRAVRLARVLAGLKLFNEAVAVLEKSRLAHPKDFWVYFALGRICSTAMPPRTAEAVRYYTAAVAVSPHSAAAHNNLGIALQAQNRLADAEAEFREAIRGRDKYPKAHNNLGNVLKAQGRLAEAEAEFRAAVKLNNDFLEAYRNLGHVLRLQGRFVEALAAYQRWHQLELPRWRAASARWVKEAKRLIEMDKKLPELLKDPTKRSSNPAEQIELAQVCRFKGWFASAVGFYAAAFAATPALAEQGKPVNRYRAACAAGLAGCGGGADPVKPTAEERAALRGRALGWLRDDLAAWSKRAESGDAGERALTQQAMERWRADAELAGVRDKDGLDKLPKAERNDWQKLWAGVDALWERTSAAGR
jgi:serine/threonine-protein kinase